MLMAAADAAADQQHRTHSVNGKSPEHGENYSRPLAGCAMRAVTAGTRQFPCLSRPPTAKDEDRDRTAVQHMTRP